MRLGIFLFSTVTFCWKSNKSTKICTEANRGVVVKIVDPNLGRFDIS